MKKVFAILLSFFFIPLFTFPNRVFAHGKFPPDSPAEWAVLSITTVPIIFVFIYILIDRKNNK